MTEVKWHTQQDMLWYHKDMLWFCDWLAGVRYSNFLHWSLFPSTIPSIPFSLHICVCLPCVYAKGNINNNTCISSLSGKLDFCYSEVVKLEAIVILYSVYRWLIDRGDGLVCNCCSIARIDGTLFDISYLSVKKTLKWITLSLSTSKYIQCSRLI